MFFMTNRADGNFLAGKGSQDLVFFFECHRSLANARAKSRQVFTPAIAVLEGEISNMPSMVTTEGSPSTHSCRDGLFSRRYGTELALHPEHVILLLRVYRTEKALRVC